MIEEPKPPQVEFVVRYKPAKPGGRDHWGNIIKPGRQGSFMGETGLEDATLAAEACRKWFNVRTDNVLNDVGTIVGTKDKHADNVIVWIDKYVDGLKMEDECEASSEALEGSTPPASTKKRKRISSTEAASVG